MGATMTASHVLTATEEGTTNTLTVDIDGPLSSFVGALVRGPISKAIATENQGFKTAAEGLTTEMGRWRTSGLLGRPFDVGNVDEKAHCFQFAEMTPDEADAYLIRHLEVADDVIATFRDRLVSITGISPDLFDYSEDTLGQIWEAVKPLWTKLEIDEYGFGDDEPPLWYHPNDPGTSRLPHHLWWIRDGLMYYTSRCLMAQSPSLRWEIERDRFMHGFNQPRIVGFDGASTHPIVDVFGMAGSVLRGGRPGDREPVDRFMSAYRLRASRAPGPGEPAVAPPVDDRYVRKDVVVAVALVDEIQDEMIDDGRPEDWAGVWSLWFPEGWDVVCGPDTREALEDEMARRRDVDRVGWADEDTMLVDAPTAAVGELRDAAIEFLNDRREAYAD